MAHHHASHEFTKVRFQKKKSPRLKGFWAAIRQLCSKLQFRFAEIDDPATGRPWYIDRKLKSKEYVKEFKGAANPALDLCLSELTRNCFRAARTGVSRSKSMSSRWSNMPTFIEYALKLLQRSIEVPIPTDKDGGWCLVNRKYLTQMYEKQLTADKYEYTPYVNVDTTVSMFESDARELARAYDCPAMQTYLFSKIRGCKRSSVLSTLMCTCKTHKERGNISLRLLHSTTGHPGAPIQYIVRQAIKPILADIPFLVANSDAALALLRALELPPYEPVIFLQIGRQEFLHGGEPLAVGRLFQSRKY